MFTLSPILRILALLVLAAALPPPHGARAADLDFVIVQPGAPGSGEEATPVMERLAAYLQDAAGLSKTPRGLYCNDLNRARDYVKTHRPDWGIVALGVFVSGLPGVSMHPIASTRPAGADTDRWHLLVARDGPDRWQDLRGRVEGTVLFAAPDDVARRLFQTDAGTLPFRLDGTRRPLRAARRVARGRLNGVVLDAVQYRTLQALPTGAKLKRLLRSDPLPTSPVVWFGEPSDTAEGLSKILRSMAQDPKATSLLEVLRTDGFGPADAALGKPLEPAQGGTR